MKQNNKLFILILAIAMVLTFFLGRQSKKCASIESVITEKVVTDTVYTSYPVYLETKSKPITYTIYKDKLVSKTDTIYDQIDFINDCMESISFDTLNYEGLKVAIQDSINCTGITSRNTIFFGTLPERIITNTNYVTLPHIEQLLSVHAGASASFSNKWKVFDVGPNLMLSLKNKHNVSISYMMNTSTINLNLSTRIK